jgi:hypothetical protein
MMGCVHVEKEKMSKIRKRVSQQPQQRIKNGNVTLSPMMLGTPRSNNDNEKSCFAKVVAFRMEMARLEAIFWYFQKTSHNFFKNHTYQIGLPPPKCMKCMVFRHEKM